MDIIYITSIYMISFLPDILNNKVMGTLKKKYLGIQLLPLGEEIQQSSFGSLEEKDEEIAGEGGWEEGGKVTPGQALQTTCGGGCMRFGSL